MDAAADPVPGRSDLVARPVAAPMILTVGHGTASESAFLDLLHAARVVTLIDVRRFPGSRRHLQFGQSEMERWLGTGRIRYRWLPGLGGRRRASPGSVNVGLRNLQFRAYADHMASAEFADAAGTLLQEASPPTAVLMCSESVWWRCHRRLLADHLVLVEGIAVEHLFHDGRVVEHPVTPGARRHGHHVVYDVAAG